MACNATGLMGHSGSGKSSLAFLIGGLIQPDIGEIGYFDHDGVKIEILREESDASFP